MTVCPAMNSFRSILIYEIGKKKVSLSTDRIAKPAFTSCCVKLFLVKKLIWSVFCEMDL